MKSIEVLVEQAVAIHVDTEGMDPGDIEGIEAAVTFALELRDREWNAKFYEERNASYGQGYADGLADGHQVMEMGP